MNIKVGPSTPVPNARLRLRPPDRPAPVTAAHGTARQTGGVSGGLARSRPRVPGPATPSSPAPRPTTRLLVPAADRPGASGVRGVAAPGLVPSTPEFRSVLALINKVKSGEVAGANLANDDRRRCVEYLTLEGYTSVDISEIFKVSERTIFRDREAIRRANALERRPETAAEVTGQFVRSSEHTISRLRRVARDPAATPQVKVDADRVAWEVQKDTVKILQSLGYLPTAAQTINGHLTHELSEAPSLAELDAEALRVQGIFADRPDSSPELVAMITSVHDDVGRSRVREALAKLTAMPLPGATP
jgi:hypothetical protein